MVPFLVVLVIFSLSVGWLSSWRRNRKLLTEVRSPLHVRDAEQTNDLEKANDDLTRAQAELQRRWQYLAEAQRLSHSGTFGWRVRAGGLVLSEETRQSANTSGRMAPAASLIRFSMLALVESGHFAAPE